MNISKRVYFNTQRSRDSSKCLLSGKRHYMWWESKKPSVIIFIQWKPFLWVGESNASTHTCCMHTSTSRRNADFCIWEQLLSEMERPTDGCIVIVGGGGRGAILVFLLRGCVCVRVCKRMCSLLPEYFWCFQGLLFTLNLKTSTRDLLVIWPVMGKGREIKDTAC